MSLMRDLAFVIFIVLMLPIIKGYPEKWKKRTPASYVYCFYCTLLILFTAFRPIGIDQDSVGYKSYYNSGNLIWLLAEPTFGVISHCVQSTWDNFRMVLIIYAILGISIKFWALKRISLNVWSTILVYFSTYYLLHDFTQIRAGVASALFLCGIYFLSKYKRKEYIILVLLAILFHYSAVILLPIAFIYVKRLKRTTILLLSLSIPVALLVANFRFQSFGAIPLEALQRKSEIYQYQAENATIRLNYFNLVYVVKYLIFYLMLFYHKMLSRKSSLFPLLIIVYSLSLFIYISLSWNTILAMRLSEMLGIVEILLIPIFCQIFKRKYIQRLFLISYSLIYLCINIYSLELIYNTPKL